MDEYAEQQAHPELIAALHQHLVDRYLELAQALQPVAWHRDTCATWFFTTHPVPFCNGVVRTECSVTEIDPLITRITQEAQKRQVPLLWLLGPASRPADLPQWLERHRVRYDETVSGMILDVRDLPEEEEQLPHLSISLVETAEQMESWLQVLCTGFGFPEAVREVVFSLYRSYGFVPNASRQYYLGTIDTIPVATSYLSLDGQLAGLYSVATLAAYRRRGIGTKMTRAALAEAKRLGYTQITLQASHMGEAIYRRLGFRKVCSFQTYVWMPV
ncbi:MAG: GNAT family N-acetyltransferase [Chloroflexi bacterium]|nr:MAG: GNAT family N-acetyltransferase [Chloroflexota bacterium]